jgi:hypothetical protein
MDTIICIGVTASHTNKILYTVIAKEQTFYLKYFILCYNVL